MTVKAKPCHRKNSGFSLIESLVGVAVFVIIAVSVYQSYAKVTDVVRVSRLKITAAALANEQLEIIRNLSYVDVGLAGGLPSGKIQREQNLIRDNVEFKVITTIRNVDDSFDGIIGDIPNDNSPADYKLVQLDISCPTCKNFTPIFFAAQVGPRALETSSSNGALFVKVFDASGHPVPGAAVHIENNQVIPAIVIDDTADNGGILQVIDAPPDAEAYEITVTKSGYSQEKTYPAGAPENPNPVKPHATVAVQQLTQISFVIDKTSVLDISSVTETCSPVGDIDFSLKGSKLIGADPNVLKYDAVNATDSLGRKTISDLEWDNYSLTLTDSVYDLIGAIPLIPLVINPNLNQDLKLIVSPKNPQSLLITVKEASTQLPLSEATARLQGNGYDNTLVTGQGFLRQTDWSGGGGQEDFIDSIKYFSSDGNIEVADPSGELRLKKVFDEYEPSGYLISSTFDTGSLSNFHQFLWQPQDQLPETGTDSVKFQIATNNDKASWIFLGPDGSPGSFYVLSGTNINAVHNGDRYLRYKLFMNTASATTTPIIADIQSTFTSSCVPPGQVVFSGLVFGDYALAVSKSDYQTFEDTVTVASPWQQYEAPLNP